VFREPIVVSNVPRLVPGWKHPIVVGRCAAPRPDMASMCSVRHPAKLRIVQRVRQPGPLHAPVGVTHNPVAVHPVKQELSTAVCICR